MSGEVPTPDYRALFGEEAWDQAIEDAGVGPWRQGGVYYKLLDSLLASGVLHIEYRPVTSDLGKAITEGGVWAEGEERTEQRLVSAWRSI